VQTRRKEWKKKGKAKCFGPAGLSAITKKGKEKEKGKTCRARHGLRHGDLWQEKKRNHDPHSLMPRPFRREEREKEGRTGGLVDVIRNKRDPASERRGGEKGKGTHGDELAMRLPLKRRKERKKRVRGDESYLSSFTTTECLLRGERGVRRQPLSTADARRRGEGKRREGRMRCLKRIEPLFSTLLTNSRYDLGGRREERKKERRGEHHQCRVGQKDGSSPSMPGEKRKEEIQGTALQLAFPTNFLLICGRASKGEREKKKKKKRSACSLVSFPMLSEKKLTRLFNSMRLHGEDERRRKRDKCWPWCHILTTKFTLSDHGRQSENERAGKRAHDSSFLLRTRSRSTWRRHKELEKKKKKEGERKEASAYPHDVFCGARSRREVAKRHTENLAFS